MAARFLAILLVLAISSVGYGQSGQSGLKYRTVQADQAEEEVLLERMPSSGVLTGEPLTWGTITTRVQDTVVQLLYSMANFDELMDVFYTYALGLSPAEVEAERFKIFSYLVAFLFLSAMGEWLYRRYVAAPRLQALRHRSSLAPGAIFMLLLLQIGIALVGIGIFALISALLVSTFLPAGMSYVHQTMVNVLGGIVVFRILEMLLRTFLSPGQTDYRLIPLSNRRALQLNFRLTFLVFLMVTGGTIIFNLASLGAPDALLDVVDSVFLVLTALVLLLFTWKDYLLPTSVDERSGEVIRPKLSRTCLVSFLILVCAFFWIAQMFSVVWLAVIFWLLGRIMSGIRDTISYLFHKTLLANRRESCEVFDDEIPEGAEDPYGWVDDEPLIVRLPIYQHIVRNGVLFVLAAWIYGVMNYDLEQLYGSGFDARFQSGFITLMLVLLLADVLWVWARTLINDRIDRTPLPVPGKVQGSESRLLTLLPLIRKAILTVLVVISGMIVLSTLGVDIAPLLASAGVIGIALGFGSQKLVEDVISGIFFLIDDAFRIGEYIEMGEIRGTVESISVRAIKLRHHKGAVHTIPYSQLPMITNYSRDWVIMKLEFRIPFETDLKLVKKLIKKLGKEMQEHPEYGHHFIEPLKSQGVRRMEEFNMVLGVKFKVTPGEQWTIRKDVYQKIRDMFDAHGLTFAQRNVVVDVRGGEGVEEEKIVAAAQQAVEAQLPKPT